MELYITAEVARMLGKTRGTILRWVAENRIRTTAKANGSPLFSLDQIEEVKEELKKYKTPAIKETLLVAS